MGDEKLDRVIEPRRSFLALGGLGVAGALASTFLTGESASAATTVTSVNGETGAVVLSPSDVGAVATADDGTVRVIATPSLFPGLDPTGVAVSTAPLTRAINATPDGGTLVIPAGTYKLDGPISCTGKSVTLDLTNATLVMVATTSGGAPGAAITMRGSYGTAYSVTATALSTVTVDAKVLRAVKITVSGTPTYVPGDVVKLIADDVIGGVRAGDGTSESRVGQFMVVQSVSGSVITTLVEEMIDTFATNVRVVKLNPISCHIIGGRVTTAQANVTTWTGDCVYMRDLVFPTIKGLEIERASNQLVHMQGCYGYEISNLMLDYGPNDGASNRYGYGILDNSCSHGFIHDYIGRNVRHAYTDDTPRITAGNTDFGSYGRTYKTKVHDSHAHGTSGISWDTHSGSQGVEFLQCTATGSGAAGFGLRGRKHRVQNCEAVGTNDGLLIYTEPTTTDSWGHVIDGLTLRNIQNSGINAVLNVMENRRSTIRNVQVDGAKQLAYLKNVSLDWSDVKYIAPVTLPNSTVALIVSSSRVVAQGTVFDYRDNTGGTSLVAISSNTGGAYRDSKVIALFGSAATAQRFSYFARGDNTSAASKIVACDVEFDFPPGPSAAGVIYNASAWDAQSMLAWRSTDDSSGASSSHYDWNTSATSNEPNGANYVSNAISRSCDMVVTVWFNVEFNANLWVLRDGRMLGQQILIINRSTVKVLTVRNGDAAYNVLTLSGADTAIAPGKLIVLVWTGSSWQQIQ